MRTFPFPDRIESREELKRDIQYDKIPHEKRVEICDMAWKRGVLTAENLIQKYPGVDIREMAAAEGLKIRCEDKDNVVGSVRYFSEYFSGKKEICLYVQSVRLWAEANALEQHVAEDLILSHEFYHHLECTSIGLTSDLYRVPILRMGKISIGKSGIRALSEIGAHGFSRTYYENSAIMVSEVNEPLCNCAMNAILCDNQQYSKKIYRDNKVLRFLSGQK